MVKISEELYGDLGPAVIVAQATGVEHGLVKDLWVDAQDIALGGLSYMREHPVGSIEVGGSIAAVGMALGAILVPRLRQAH